MTEGKKERFCPECGKRCYSEREANWILNAVKRGYRKKDSGKITKHVSKQIPKRKYWCPYCHSYHLTSWSYYREYKDYE